MSQVLTKVSEGQRFKITMWVGGHQRKVDHTVKPACNEKHDGTWVCVTHDEIFDNQLQKDIHINTGTHELVWFCRQHGAEVP